MSLIPEFVLQTTIVRGIKTLRNDSRFIEQLFRNLSQSDQSHIVDFIQKNSIDLTLNYPRDTLKVPAIVILLRSENESAERQGVYLNDTMGFDTTPEFFEYAGDIPPDVLLGGASVTSLSGLGSVVLPPTRASGGTPTTVSLTTANFKPDEFSSSIGVPLGLREIRIIGGTGVGQTRTVVANTATSITVNSAWNTIPDATSIIEIRTAASEILGEPSSLYDSRNTREFIERKGSLYNLNYQVQVIGSNPEQTIYLYTILKAILTLSRTFLEGQGVINLRMGGTDFLPRTDYLPDIAYMRALNVQFLYPFDIFVPLEDLATQFNIALEVCDDSGTALEVSTTSSTVGRPPVIIA